MRLLSWFLSLSIAAVGGLPQAARASGGPCEDMLVRYKLVAAAPDAKLLAFEVEIPYCAAQYDETHTTALLVTDLQLGARRWFISPKAGPEADAVKAVAGATLEKAADWPALQREKGFSPVSSIEADRCGPVQQVAIEGTRVVPMKGANRKVLQRRLGVRLRGGKAPAVEIAKGHSIMNDSLVALPVTGLRVYASILSCIGGRLLHTRRVALVVR